MPKGGGINRASILEKLSALNIDLEAIENKEIAKAFVVLFQIIEELAAANDELRQENQKLRDENNKLKGEQGKPDIKPSNKNKDTSSERERKKHKSPKQKKSKAKKYKIKIDKTEICRVDRNLLPPDAEFKGYQPVVVQEIKITTVNTQYDKEIYYSASEKKTYIAKLPQGVEGEFGPGIKSFAINLKRATNVSEPKIVELFDNVGIYISPAEISRILTKERDIGIFLQEKEEILKAGLQSTIYQQIDDTGARVNGQNQFVQIICNPYYTAYFTMPKKSRLSILDVLRGGAERVYLFNEEAFSILQSFNLAQKWMTRLRKEADGKILSEEEMKALFDRLFTKPKQGQNIRARMMEAGLIAAYHEQIGFPVIPILMSDDAPQYKLLAQYHALCWIHEGRHYKKLDPVSPLFRKELEEFQSQFWVYYQKLLDFKESPSEDAAKRLSKDFDDLFSTICKYPFLADRIEKTRAKKENLLLVLKWPELPLHNNASELGARAQARVRDVSFQTKSDEGTKAKDALLTIVQTAKKLGVSTYKYIHDRVSKTFEMPSLAELIIERAAQDHSIS